MSVTGLEGFGLTANEERQLRKVAQERGQDLVILARQFAEVKQTPIEELVRRAASVKGRFVSLTASEEAHARALAERNGQDPETFLQTYREVVNSRPAKRRRTVTASEAAPGTLTASEEAELREQARRNGLDFETLKATHLEVKARRRR